MQLCLSLSETMPGLCGAINSISEPLPIFLLCYSFLSYWFVGAGSWNRIKLTRLQEDEQEGAGKKQGCGPRCGAELCVFSSSGEARERRDWTHITRSLGLTEDGWPSERVKERSGGRFSQGWWCWGWRDMVRCGMSLEDRSHSTCTGHGVWLRERSQRWALARVSNNWVDGVAEVGMVGRTSGWGGGGREVVSPTGAWLGPPLQTGESDRSQRWAK